VLYISGSNIKMTRGDTVYLTIPLKLSTGAEAYEMQPGDTLTLSVKRCTRDDEYLLQKVVDGDNTIHIEPIDTSSLPFGKFKYDVELVTSDGDVFTVIPSSTFELLEEVTCR